MAGPGQARFYSSTFVQTSLAAGIGPSTTTFNVGVTTGAPGTPFVVSVDQNTASEELMLVTNVTGLQYTVTRAVGGTGAVTHANGASVVHVMYAQDLTDASAHIGAYDGVHGLAAGSLVVGTADIQTLLDKTLVTPVLTSPTISTPTISGATSAGAITSNASVTAVDFAATGLTGAVAPSRYVGATSGGPPSSGSFAQCDYVVDMAGTFWVCIVTGSPGTWMGVANLGTAQTLTNKTLTSPLINTPTIVSATMNGTWTGSASLTTSGVVQGGYLTLSGKTGAVAATSYAGGTVSGAPTSGAFVVGDFVVDHAGRMFVCTTAGSPGTWLQVGGALGTVAAPLATSSIGTATSGTTETFDAVLGSLSVTLISGRRYRASINGLIGSAGAALDVQTIQIRDSGSASPPTSGSTLIAQSEWAAPAAGSGGRQTIPIAMSFTASSSGTHTFGMSATKIAGTGPFTPLGIRELLVEDLGTF